MSRIFICYRHDDTKVEAILVRDRLIRHFGAIVDMDVAIPPGVDWRTWIEERLTICDVAVVLIGRQWLTLASEGGHLLGDPEDQLTHEIKTALDRADVTVIPVLVQDAPRPRLDELPSALREIDRVQDFRISLSDWDHHGQRLVEQVEPYLTRDPDPRPPPTDPIPPDPPRVFHWWMVAAAAVAVLVGVAAAVLISRGDGGEPIVVKPGGIVFGDQQVGSKSGFESVKVANDSGGEVTIQAFAITPKGDFEREDSDCIASNPLPPSSSCTVRIAFEPSTGGPRDARLIVLRQGSAQAQFVTLHGSGTATPPRNPEPAVVTGTAAVTTIVPTDTGVATLTEGPPATAPP